MHKDASPFQLTINHDAQGAHAKATGRFVLGRPTDDRLWAPVMTLAVGRVLTLDLCGVVQLDAAGIAVLVRLEEHARRHGGWVRLAAASARVRRLLALTRIDRVLAQGHGYEGPSGQGRASLAESPAGSGLGRMLAQTWPIAHATYEASQACA